MLIIAGVSGCGKTTVGALLAGQLGWDFADADDFHPDANVAKMRSGIPLDDADRQPWLRAIGAWMDAETAVGRSAVLGCSALKRAYRDLLLAGRPDAYLVFLLVGPDELDRRLHARHGHFFPEKLLSSQLATLEPPQPDEERVLAVTAGSSPAQTAAAVLAALPVRPRADTLP